MCKVDLRNADEGWELSYLRNTRSTPAHAIVPISEVVGSTIFDKAGCTRNLFASALYLSKALARLSDAQVPIWQLTPCTQPRSPYDEHPTKTIKQILLATTNRNICWCLLKFFPATFIAVMGENPLWKIVMGRSNWSLIVHTSLNLIITNVLCFDVLQRERTWVK